MNSLAVPRKAKEAIGGIAALKKPDGNTLTINVEYNLLDPLLRASGWADGDVNDDTGYSPYPGAVTRVQQKQLLDIVILCGQPQSVHDSYGHLCLGMKSEGRACQPMTGSACYLKASYSCQCEIQLCFRDWLCPPCWSLLTRLGHLWARPLKNSCMTHRSKAAAGCHMQTICGLTKNAYAVQATSTSCC